MSSAVTTSSKRKVTVESPHTTTMSSSEDFLNLKVKDSRNTDGTSAVIECRVFKDATVQNLKCEIMCHAKENPEAERQRLIHNGRELTNSQQMLREYGVTDNAVLHLVVRPRGSGGLPIQPIVSAAQPGQSAGPMFDSSQPYGQRLPYMQQQAAQGPGSPRSPQNLYANNQPGVGQVPQGAFNRGGAV